MKNILFIITILFLVQCKEPQKTSVPETKKNYTFDYSKETKEPIDNLDLFLGKEEYELKKRLISIDKEEFIKDSLAYVNDIENTQTSIFNNNILKTKYGTVTFVSNSDQDSDAKVDYRFLGFSKALNSYLINVELYAGETTLLLNADNYQFELMDNSPIIAPNKKMALSYKNDEMGSRISFYHIKNTEITHFLTLWEEAISISNIFWSSNSEIVIRLNSFDATGDLYYKLKIE